MYNFWIPYGLTIGSDLALMIITRTQTHALDATSLAEVYQDDPLTGSGTMLYSLWSSCILPPGRLPEREKEITISLSMRPPLHMATECLQVRLMYAI